MTRDDIKIMWPLLEAFRDGKVIQSRLFNGGWGDCTEEDILFSRGGENYRIKPTPLKIKVAVKGSTMSIVGATSEERLKSIGWQIKTFVEVEGE